MRIQIIFHHISIFNLFFRKPFCIFFNPKNKPDSKPKFIFPKSSVVSAYSMFNVLLSDFPIVSLSYTYLYRRYISFIAVIFCNCVAFIQLPVPNIFVLYGLPPSQLRLLHTSFRIQYFCTLWWFLGEWTTFMTKRAGDAFIKFEALNGDL